MKKFKYDKVKKEALLKYVDSVAVIYYTKHRVVYEKDSISISDLKQEAKIICLTLIERYGEKDGKTKFDLKKFICRAVGWKMNDFLRQAIKNTNNTIRISEISKFPDEGSDSGVTNDENEPTAFANWTKDDFLENIDPKILFGFDVNEIYTHFSGKELTILKKMIECNSREDIHKEMGYKNNNSTREIWNENILPKLKRLLKNQIKEYRP